MLSLDFVVRFCASQSRQLTKRTSGKPLERHWLHASDSHTLTKPYSSLVIRPNLRTIQAPRFYFKGLSGIIGSNEDECL